MTNKRCISKMTISYMIKWCARLVGIIDFVMSICFSLLASAIVLLALSCTLMTRYMAGSNGSAAAGNMEIDGTPYNSTFITIANTSTTITFTEDSSSTVKNFTSELCSAFLVHVPLSTTMITETFSVQTAVMWMLALLMAFLLVEPLYANTELLRATFSAKMEVEVREAIRLMRFWTIPYVIYTVFGLMLILYYHAHWIHLFSWLSFRAFCLLVVRTYMEELKMHPNHDNVIIINTAAWEGTPV